MDGEKENTEPMKTLNVKPETHAMVQRIARDCGGAKICVITDAAVRAFDALPKSKRIAFLMP